MEIKIEAGANVQITDKQIVNNILYGDYIAGNKVIEKGSSDNNTNDVKTLSMEKLTSAIEKCQEYFWGNSAYAVVFCVCRDVYGMEDNKSAFERKIELLPYSKNRRFTCPPGTLNNAFSDNPFYNDKIEKWDAMNVMSRVILLRDELIKELEL